MAMIFQEPMTSLNPVFTVGDQIAEAITLHQNLDHENAFKQAIELLDRVGIPSPEKRARDFPHQLSGDRDASARDDRHGRQLQAQNPDRG